MATRRATLRSFAKINLDLRVLHKRADGYHELRTVFQTISLRDAIDIEYTTGRRTEIAVEGNVDIPDNLVVRAARTVFDAVGAIGRVSFRLRKRIPMGAGLGGGSSNAAAVLLALPALTGKFLNPGALNRAAAELGSDVPFFLHGGTAIGIGRGTELYPVPDAPAMRGIVVAPAIHVSTPEAYQGLRRALTSKAGDFDTNSFQSFVWGLGDRCPTREWRSLPANDFESSVFRQYPSLLEIKRKLARLGASPAMMSGSGSALFGLFSSSDDAARAARAFVAEPLKRGGRVFRISLVSRRRYQAVWLAQLKDHVVANVWPPQSRYSKQ
jgi:4-diphosphocytidyl-2-C-methyl-D-erythritol kinase